MRIAVFHNLSSGGAKRALCELVRRLVNRHDVDVFTLASADHGFADLRPFVRHHRVFGFSPAPLFDSPFGRLNMVSRTIDLLRLRSVARSIARSIEQGAYQVVLVNPCRFENSPSILSEFTGCPGIFYCQEVLRSAYEPMPARPYLNGHVSRRKLLDQVDPLPPLFRSLLRRRDSANIASADLVLVNSAFSRQAVRDAYGIDARVNYLGVDTERFRPDPAVRKSVLLSVGSLTPLKGFDFLIRAAARIAPDVRPPLAIVSNFENPPERRYLEQLAGELSVEMTLHGNVTEERLVELYNRAAVVGYAPIREPFGFVPIEAMACGTPVVGVADGGVTETVVHEETGLLVERDLDQFAGAVERLLRDGNVATEFGRSGRRRAESDWTWDRAVSTLEGHLEVCQSK